MKPIELSFCIVSLAAAVAAADDAFREVLLPKGTQYVDVTKAPYNAKPDGKTDCTAAIQKALYDSRQVYLPAGTYLVSDVLIWGIREGEAKRRQLQGQSRDKTVLKLKDNCPGYGDVGQPREVLRLASRGNLAGPANAFRNAVYDVTIDVGKGNPGAVGILFYVHNQGAMENVRVVAGDGSGHCGVDLYRGLTGPGLVKNTEVVGFDYGIRAGGTVRHIALENIVLKDQRTYGLYNDSNALSICGLKSVNKVPAVHNRAGWGFISLVNADLTGGASGSAAIENSGYMFVRNAETGGYGRAIVSHGKATPGAKVDEWTSHPYFSLFESPGRSLNLPIEQTPDVEWEAPGKWVNLAKSPPKTAHRTVRGKPRAYSDYSGALQKVIDSGATTIYFGPLPKGKKYGFAKPVLIRGKARRLIGMEENVEFRAKGPDFRVVDGEAPVVVIERFERKMATSHVHVEIDTARTVVLKNSIYHGVRTTKKAGKVFLDDICGGPFEFHGGRIWARQLNPEGLPVKIDNDGATLWIMGLKTERGGTVLRTTGGGKTELLGGMLYSTTGPKPAPAFPCKDSSMSLTFGEASHNGCPFEVPVAETRGGKTRTLKWAQTFRRDGWGTAMPLYVGYAAKDAAANKPPSLPDTKIESIITDMVVHDKTRMATKYSKRTAGSRWGIGKNLQAGEMRSADSQFVISHVPEELRGCDFIRVNVGNYRREPPADPAVSFRLTKDAYVYGTVKADGWEDTGRAIRLIYSYNGGPSASKHTSIVEKPSPLFRKLHKAGATVSLPPWNLIIVVKEAAGGA